jgi:hypothetical protein
MKQIFVRLNGEFGRLLKAMIRAPHHYPRIAALTKGI